MDWVTLNIALPVLAYLASTFAQMAYLLAFQEQWMKRGQNAFLVAYAIHCIATVHLVTTDSGDAVFMPGFLTSLGLSTLYFVLSRVATYRIWGSVLVPISTAVLIASWSGLEPATTALPGVMSVVTPLHIVASILGIVAFFVAFVLSALYVIQDYNLKERKDLSGSSRIPPQVRLTRMSSKALSWGFPLYTIGILVGAVWAVKGDPPTFSFRYVLAVVSWVVYGVVIQGRRTVGWSGRRSALFTLVGFLGAFTVLLMYMNRSLV